MVEDFFKVSWEETHPLPKLHLTIKKLAHSYIAQQE